MAAAPFGMQLLLTRPHPHHRASVRGGQETASEFLAAITQHIPDNGAQMVRY